MKLDSLSFVDVPPSPLLPFYLGVSASFGRARVSWTQFPQHCAHLPYPLWSYGYFSMMHRAGWEFKGLKSESLKELPTFPTPCLCAYSFLPWSNFNKDYVTTWCWHSTSNIIPSVSRENVKTCVSIMLRLQFSTVKNQATLKLQAAFQSYSVIFLAFVFLELEFRHL